MNLWENPTKGYVDQIQKFRYNWHVGSQIRPWNYIKLNPTDLVAVLLKRLCKLPACVLELGILIGVWLATVKTTLAYTATDKVKLILMPHKFSTADQWWTISTDELESHYKQECEKVKRTNWNQNGFRDNVYL